MPAKGKGHGPFRPPLMQVELRIANDLDRGSHAAVRNLS